MLLSGIFTGFSSSAYYTLPVRQEFELKAGDEKDIEYVFVNDAEKERVIEISAIEWRHYAWNREIKLEDWLAFTPKQLRVSPAEQKKLSFHVRVPETARGELVAMIYFCDADSTRQYKVKFGVSAYVLVKNTIQRDFEIQNVIIRQVDEKDGKNIKLQIAVALFNRGNIHLRPALEAEIIAPGGNMKVILKFGDPVFPGESVVYNGELPLTRFLADGVYPVTLDVREAGLEHDRVQKGTLQVLKGVIQFKKNNQGAP